MTTDKDYLQSWNDDHVVQFFVSNRNSIEDIYPSERHFLDKYIKPDMKVLDYGCAAGGFCNILTDGYQLPPKNYWGVDQSLQMIQTARRLHPLSNFETDLSPFFQGDPTFDLIFSFGVLHMTFDWEEILYRLYRLSRKYLIFDLRVIDNDPTIEDISKSYQKLGEIKTPAGQTDTSLSVPYIILNSYDLDCRFSNIFKKSDAVLRHGYTHPVSKIVVSPYKEVEMAAFCVIKQKP